MFTYELMTRDASCVVVELFHHCDVTHVTLPTQVTRSAIRY